MNEEPVYEFVKGVGYMDQNKLNKLKDIGYEIKPSCGTCKFFNQHSDAEFGDCQKHTYVHRKHSGGERPLSVCMFGCCGSYEPTELDWLHGFKEFLTSDQK